MVFEGTEKHPSLGKAPVTLHLGTDGTAVATVLDPTALAFGWVGAWIDDGSGSVTVDLDPVGGQGDSLIFDLQVKGSGRAKGTLARTSDTAGSSSLKLKSTYPARKAKGWSVVVPHLRTGFETAAGSFRTTLSLRRLDPPGSSAKKNRPVDLSVRAVSAGGLPGVPGTVSLAPGESVRLAGAQIPMPPAGLPGGAYQLEITGPKTFAPEGFSIAAVEETLRGSDPAADGGAVGVRWLRALKKKEAASLDAAPLVGAWFRDDDGAGPLPRSVSVILRDVSPAMGLPGRESVRVAILDLAGTTVATSIVDLPRGAAVEVPVRDVLDGAFLSGGEGQVRVTDASGDPLPRDTVAGELVTTVTASAVPVSEARVPLVQPEAAGRSARLVAALVPAPGDGSTTSTLRVLWLGDAATNLPVKVIDPDGNVLLDGVVPVQPGAVARADPLFLGAGGSEFPTDRLTVILGDTAGLPVDRLVAYREIRRDGDPDTLFADLPRFPSPPAGTGGTALHLADLQATQGSDPGDLSATVAMANATAGDVTVRARAFVGSTPVGSQDAVLVVAAGTAPRFSLETLLALMGAPVADDPFRGDLRLDVEEGAVPPVVEAEQHRFTVDTVGGHPVPVEIR